MSTTQLVGVASAFALVAYINGKLGAFIDEMSAWLPGESRAKAHLTLLPPRPLALGPDQAVDMMSAALASLQPFEVELTGIARFPVTDVLYVELGLGRDKAHQAHEELNRGVFFYKEPFEYRPHVTLMVPRKDTDVGRAHRAAAERWTQFNMSKRFVVDRLDFLQQDSAGQWENLQQIRLGEGP